jgi:hypothetical protein
MARKCTYCRAEIPAKKDCTDNFQAAGFCGKDHYIEHATAKGLAAVERKKKREAAQKRQEATEKRKDIRKRKEAMKTLSDWVNDAQKVINRLVVLEDGLKGCISCGSPEVTDCGHYFHRGSKYRRSWLTLDRKNLNGQCAKCNRFAGGGNQHFYRLGYIERYGQAQFDALCDFKCATDRGEVAEPTIEEIKDFIDKNKIKIKEIERERNA